jgi:ORF6N domain
VTTKAFNHAVKRNLPRFPLDFSFVLAEQDIAGLISQIAISKTGRGGRRNLPRVFKEHGAMMASTILNSPRAIEMSLYVVRAFVEMRAALVSSVQLSRKLDALEKTVVVLDVDSKRQFKELRTLVFSLAMPPAKDQ